MFGSRRPWKGVRLYGLGTAGAGLGEAKRTAGCGGQRSLRQMGGLRVKASAPHPRGGCYQKPPGPESPRTRELCCCVSLGHRARPTDCSLCYKMPQVESLTPDSVCTERALTSQ